MGEKNYYATLYATSDPPNKVFPKTPLYPAFKLRVITPKKKIGVNCYWP